MVALGGDGGEGFFESVFFGLHRIVLFAKAAEARRQRLRFGLPVIALLGEFGESLLVGVAGGGELAGERVVRGAEGGVLAVERGVGCAVLLFGGGEFGGKGLGLRAEVVALGGGVAERFAERALGDLQGLVLGVEFFQSGRVRLLRRRQFRGERVGFGAQGVAFIADFRAGFLMRRAGGGGFGGEGFAGGVRVGELAGDGRFFGAEFFVRGAEFAVRLGLGVVRLAGGGEFAFEGGALLLPGGGEGVRFREQVLAFLLRGVALVGELFFFRLQLADGRVAARACGFEFAGEPGALGAEILAGGGGDGNGGQRGGEFRGEAGLFAAEFFVRRAELGERLHGLAARGFGGGVLPGGLRGFVLRFFHERGFFLRRAQFGGKALALLVRGAEFVPEFFHGGGEAAVFFGGLFPVRRARGHGELRGERVLFPGDGIALGEQFFDAPAVALDVFLELRHGPRLPRLRRRRRPET